MSGGEPERRGEIMEQMRYEIALGLFKSRRSCRDFLPHSVGRDNLQKVIDAGPWTPSSHNSQGSCVLIIDDPAKQTELRRHTRELMKVPDSFDPFYGAPEILAVVNSGPSPDLALLDGSMTVYNMLLAATTLRLGSCWVNTAQYEMGLPDSVLKAACAKWGIGKAYGVGYVALGWPSSKFFDDLSPRPRKGGRVCVA